ncbi:ribonuclease H-like domain-containing protein [Tanacetum coccineum]
MWRLRIEQYFQIQDYALWDIIENGKSFNPVARTTTNVDGNSTSTIPGHVTTEEKTQKKNHVKDRSMLLMALPNEHSLTFNQYKDAKTLFEAIQTRFGGNDATKKTQKTLLKQMYENFNAPSIDSLYSFFNRTNDVNTANVHVSTASSIVSTDSTLNSTANLSDATVYAFLANQPNGSQLVHEDLEQIHEDDLEEMDLKWQLALLRYDKSKVECFNCHKMGHFARECRGPRNQESRARNQDNSRRTMNVEDISSKAMVSIDGAGFDWSYMEDKKVLTNLALMAFSDSEGNRVTSAVGEQGINVVKSSACWHNMVAFLQKPTGSEEFHQIVNFLAGSHIRYALTANPTIYVSLIEQFWQTATVETVNDGE